MNISELSLRRPILAFVMNIMIVLFGLIGYKFLGIRDYPAIDPPNVNVRTSYSGANADIIESQITEPLEKSINGIAGIKNITSLSSVGTSNINIEFELGIDLEAAANDVRDKVSQAVRHLPQDLTNPPVVSKADANADAILSMTVQSNTRNALQLTDYATNTLAERLQTIPGVSSIQVWGERKYAMRIWLDPGKLSAYSLTPLDIQTALNKENVELPSGKIAGNTTELTVRTFGRLYTEEDFENVIIKSGAQGDIRLKNVGEAILGPENEESQGRESNVTMVALGLVPLPGANYVEIANEFYRRLEQIEKDVPQDINLKILMDQTVVHQTRHQRSGRNAPHFDHPGCSDYLPLFQRHGHCNSSTDRYSGLVGSHFLHYVFVRLLDKRTNDVGYRSGYRLGCGRRYCRYGKYL